MIAIYIAVILYQNTIKIGENIFRDFLAVTLLTIGNFVTKLGDCAFQKCAGLITINIPDSVTSMPGIAPAS